MRFSFYIICLLFSLSHGILSAEVRLPAIISDNMVLQQRTKVTLWGKASPGEEVFVRPSWSKKGYSTKANGNGKWRLRIQTPAAKTGQSILIEGTNRIQIENVLIGEVWLCSGQSNMEFPVSKGESWRTGILDEEKEMQDANYPEIRLFQVKHQVSPDREMDECEGVWQVCNREHLKTFSAVAFFFGREIYKEIGMPVGLIQSTWRGTPAEAWTKPSVITSDPVYAGLVRDYERMQVNYPSDLENYRKELEEYETKRISGYEDIRPSWKPLGIYDPKVLSTLWNGMIHPLFSYRIRG